VEAARGIAIPYNTVKIRDAILGFDSFFWDHTEIRARKVLMIRPVDQLEDSVEPGYIALKPKTLVGSQIRDLVELRDEIAHTEYQRAIKLNKWRLRRFIGLPSFRKKVDETPDGGEDRYAYLVLRALQLEDAKPWGTTWLNLVVHISEKGIVAASRRGVDKYYTWLAGHDKVFHRALLSVLNIGVQA